MYHHRPEAVKEVCEERCENNYTMTMFYLAQAYGALQKPSLSARFCAETMSRQLESNTAGQRSPEIRERDPFDPKEWIRNCCAISDFFVNEGMFWTAEYLLHSGLVLCDRSLEIAGMEPENLTELKAECWRDIGNMYATRLKFARACAERPDAWEEVWRGERRKADDTGAAVSHEGTKLSFRVAADRVERPPEGGTGTILWDDVFPEVVYLEDDEAQDNVLAEEHEASPDFKEEHEDRWLHLGPNDKICLPVHFRLLHEHVQRRMCRANTGFLQQRGEIPKGADKAQSPPSCIGTSFEAAREIFKMANHFFVMALEYFLLDGWVTEHVRILQELSQMYRTLHFWEKDPKRSAAMLKRRAALLCPLLEQLSPKVYVAFWRQLSYTSAEIYQELFELKAKGKLPGLGPLGHEDDEEDKVDVKKAARCNELAKHSIKYYGIFLDSYHSDSKSADQVERDHASAYLQAKLNRARLRTKMMGISVDQQIEGNKLALDEYEEILEYGQRNPEVVEADVNMSTEMRLCAEMAALLPSKLARLARRTSS